MKKIQEQLKLCQTKQLMSISYPSMRTTDTQKQLHSHPDGGVDGDGEADLGEGQENRDQVGEGVEVIKWIRLVRTI